MLPKIKIKLYILTGELNPSLQHDKCGYLPSHRTGFPHVCFVADFSQICGHFADFVLFQNEFWSVKFQNKGFKKHWKSTDLRETHRNKA